MKKNTNKADMAIKANKSAKFTKKDGSAESMTSNAILALFTQYIEFYIESRQAANLSEKTIYNAKLILERFYQYLADELSENDSLTLEDINKYFLNNYLNKLTADGLSKTTQKLHLTVIKSFIYFIADSDVKLYGLLKINITGLKIKTEQKEKEGFSQSEQTRLINYLKQLDQGKSYLAQRNSLLLKILFYTGVRISELINIKYSDIVEHYDEQNGYMYILLIKGKGNKERYTYLAYDEIASNLEFIKNRQTSSSPYLFLSTQGSQCNRTVLFGVIKNILAKAGINKSGIHIFRHTFARKLVDKDINLSTIKDLLGHSNISITAQFYAKSNENAKRNALFKK